MTVLTIADCHGHLDIEELKNTLEHGVEAVEAVILLGDNDLSDIEKVLAVVPEELPILGVLGNHDSKDFYKEVNEAYHDRITDISGRVVRLNGTRIGGLSGSLRYKDEDCYCMYTEKEYEAFLKGMECDVLVSHTPPSCCTKKDADEAHRGIKALTKYIRKKKPDKVFYGHIHEYDIMSRKGKTDLIGCYGIENRWWGEGKTALNKVRWLINSIGQTRLERRENGFVAKCPRCNSEPKVMTRGKQNIIVCSCGYIMEEMSQ